ncbi:3-hydroxyacyl-CoA dehydrogenase family protein [Allokutzneria sp. A3M-2-11 16]|uniref:3-hydroxyacyl-CoA dehydrogenase family protein n=1 Tax=Allokutzneria sp. A3M-2-11 16 TaxID=2962043 RepID=UPI0020B6F371|nr:3-hydroxyacyl-CoA dehydrogenase family protein [Allokutzneria sp. A3M-2-11 16]MCP3805307.1 3-hydroxyacyl-CoA dehydrogenase family protein [Allokutzneria sp. A3M-2-11 16]
MSRVGVIGAGVMGTGMTQSLVEHGHDVVLVDRTDEALERALAEAENYRRFGSLLGRVAPEIEGKVTSGTDFELLSDVDFVIENVTEDWAVKQEVYRTLDQVCPPRCAFAANTSAIPITRIAGATSRPDRVLGMHFMNPVPMKRSVEVIKGWHTSEETITEAMELLSSFGKEGILVKDSPGFVSNRVLMLTVNEAVYLVHDGVASAEDVDKLFRSCFGHPMGPLETADLIGLDTILLSVEVLHESFADSKYRPCPLLKQMVDAGLHGRKSGQGFYTYR